METEAEKVTKIDRENKNLHSFIIYLVEREQRGPVLTHTAATNAKR